MGAKFIAHQAQSVLVLEGAVGKTSEMQRQTQRLSVQELFAANMRRIRLEKKLIQENVAEAAELHPNYISSVECGTEYCSLYVVA
ncbi:MAG: helix-turn-helix transcriptional regulator [Gallionella sp.]